MSDNEVESFEITDYDLETEFNPSRYRKNLSKNQRIYGIWADESDEEENGSRGSNSFAPKGSKGSSYKGPVAFVSGGIHKPSDKEKVAEEETEDKPNDLPVTDSSSEDEVQLQMPNRFGKSKRITQFNMNMIAGMRTKHSGVGKGLDMYGMGAKMAMKMGYQPGKGLGKDLQGIAAPIEAQVRKGRGAIGAYGREAKQKPAEIIGGDSPKSTPSDKTGGSSSTANKSDQKWQKQTNKKVEYHYITAEEVLDQKHLRTLRPDAGHLAKVKVIDLTGPEQRILSGYHAISGQQKPTDEWEPDLERPDSKKEVKKIQVTKSQSAFEMPELLHNLYLLKDTCEEDIIRNDNKSRHASNRQIEIEEEEKKCVKTIANEDKLIATLEDVMAEVENLSKNQEMNSVFISLGKLQRDHPEEWELYQLYNLVSPLAVEFLKGKLKLWNPLEVPQWPLEMFMSWATLLSDHTEQIGIIIWEAWMPSFRQAMTYWNVKDPECMLKLLELWRHLIPLWVMQHIQEQLILPKVNQAVEDWDPLSDEIPINSWIHPWLPILGAHLDIVYPTIRRKLGNALGEWHPSDFSAKLILTPWINVFSKGTMDTFLIKNIVPKLMNSMQEVIMSPILQVQDCWKWVMDWVDIVPVKSLVNILDSVFFPRWLQFLIGWLNQIPNYDEVSRWYSWWRSIFPELLSAEPSVREYFQKALEMLGVSIQNPGQRLDFSYILSRSSATGPNQNASATPHGAAMTISSETMVDALRMTSQVPHGFKELVQMKCEELGLLFVPFPNRYYEGKQVYRVGNVSIYINANVIYIQRDTNLWTPTSLQQLIQAASIS